jgi:hypothetical protein
MEAAVGQLAKIDHVVVLRIGLSTAYLASFMTVTLALRV